MWCRVLRDETLPHAGPNAECAVQGSAMRGSVDPREYGAGGQAAWAVRPGARPQVFHGVPQGIGERMLWVITRGLRPAVVVARGQRMV